MIAHKTCLICGYTSNEVTVGLVCWRDPVDDNREFEAIPRCPDRQACRIRCEAQGEPWPTIDITFPSQAASA